jgi:DNA replication ATP-dependent helicase Dna2
MGRVAFLHIPAEAPLPGQKTSREEAAWAARLTRYFMQQYEAGGKTWSAEKSLGIITPWRAQIAQIRAALLDEGISTDDVTIDTVERYQGGARDIIIISTCVHDLWQLQSLISLSVEEVDRKMNVALTRARHHVVMLGNREVLENDPRYRAFMERYSMEISDLLGEEMNETL